MATSLTIFVLGAGASKPYGFPTSAELTDRVIELLGSVCSPPRRAVSPHADKFGGLFHAAGFKPEDASKFLEALRASQCGSLDSFLEHAPQAIQQLGKSVMAAALVFSESMEQLLDPRAPDGSRLPSWYRTLFGAMFESLRDNDQTGFVFVTFNYDRSLETLLVEALKARLHITREDAAAKVGTVSILHVHGKIADHAYGQSDVRTLGELAGTIRIVTDQAPFGEGDLARARRLFAKTDRIFFLGFGYDERNLDKILPRECPAEAVGTAFGLPDDERRRIEHMFRERNIRLQLRPSEEDISAFVEKVHPFT